MLFRGSSKTLAKLFSKPLYIRKLKKHEVSQLFDQSQNSVSCGLNKINVKQEDLTVIHLNIS